MTDAIIVTMVTGVGKPILVIPWVVMQELDSLKVSVFMTSLDIIGMNRRHHQVSALRLTRQ